MPVATRRVIAPNDSFKPMPLRGAAQLSYRDRRLNMVQKGFGCPGCLPEIALRVSGDHVVLAIDGRGIVGEQTCRCPHDTP
jgi:hypothetical protein